MDEFSLWALVEYRGRILKSRETNFNLEGIYVPQGGETGPLPLTASNYANSGNSLMSMWYLQQKKTRGNFGILDTASGGRRDTNTKTKQPLQLRRETVWTCMDRLSLE